MVLGLVAVVGLVAVRHGGHEDRSDRTDQSRDDLPRGQQRKLERLPQAPNPRGQGSDQMGPGQMGPDQRNGQGDSGNGLGPLMRGAMGLGNVLHGEFTAQDNGKATVMTMQRGEVTKASATSVTVKSSDAFTATYVIGADTRGKATDLKVGDSVVVVAAKAGAKAVLVVATPKG
jgi:hypothetical protein